MQSLPTALLLSLLSIFPVSGQQPTESFMAMVRKDKGGHFVKPASFDWDRILPAPPAIASLGSMADIETVLQVQTWRSPEQVAWAQLTDSDTLFNFSSVIGPWFTASNLPTCHGTFRKVAADIYAVCESAKKRYSRPRPPQADASVKPCVNVPHNTSYPSGHSAQAFVSAHILSELFPEHRKDLLARAHKVAWGRIIAGVHFPTDDVAGRILAETAFTMMMKNPAFLKALEQCRQELSPFRMKKAG